MKIILIFMLAFFVGSTLWAQNSALVGDVQYTTEIQYDFKERCNQAVEALYAWIHAHGGKG